MLTRSGLDEAFRTLTSVRTKAPGSTASAGSTKETERVTDRTYAPHALLNLILSCLAATQGAILLIAAKRADQISSELAIHDYETNVEADRIVHAIHDLMRQIHGRVCRPPDSAGDSSP